MSMKRTYFYASAVFSLALSGPAIAADFVECFNCENWNRPQEPFRIHGNTHYVGTQGLSSILVTSDSGHILIDGGLPQSAPFIAANIETLGFRIEDVELILNSHVHFDHAGGIAELQRLSGARVAASMWSEEAMREGGLKRGDPQFVGGIPIAVIADTTIIADGDTLSIGANVLTAHFTPGHTPGGTSWSWRSCEGEYCFDIVYADSLSPVSANGFTFTRSTDYPNALTDFETSFAKLESLPCDILLSPHPGFTELFSALERRQTGDDSTSFVDSNGCRNYVATMRDWLMRRVAEENAALTD